MPDNNAIVHFSACDVKAAIANPNEVSHASAATPRLARSATLAIGGVFTEAVFAHHGIVAGGRFAVRAVAVSLNALSKVALR